MKTYAEQNGSPAFDWNEFLDRAIYGDFVTPLEWYSVSILSSDWTTCACGNQCSVLPRHKSGEPKNVKLSNLGAEFHRFIVEQDAKSAKDTLNKIEQQSSKLIKIINKSTYQQ